MKKLIFLSTFSAMMILSSCSNEDSLVKEDSLTNLSTKDESSINARVGKEGVLYSYTTSQQYVTESQQAITQLSLDDSDYIASHSNVTKIVNKIKKTGGNGLIVEKHFLNVQTGKIVKSLYLNETTFQYTEMNVNQPLIGSPVNDLVVSCPQGTTFLGSCSGNQGVSSYSFCVANIAGNFSISTSSCASAVIIQVNALFSSSFCGGGC